MPADTTFPKYASRIAKSEGSLARAPWMAIDPNSEPFILRKEPQNLAIGVRAILTITIFVIVTACAKIKCRSRLPAICANLTYVQFGEMKKVVAMVTQVRVCCACFTWENGFD
jgi:hypothetical protein